MLHEEYLTQLILGFAGDPRQPRAPENSGSSAADAVARWIAEGVAQYALNDCNFEPIGPTGHIMDISNARVWARWTAAKREDVDMTVTGFESEAGRERYRRHSIKIVAQRQAGDRIFLRLTDWSTALCVDFEGQIAKSARRWLIRDRSRPLRWTRRRPRPAPRRARARLQPCCREALRNIAGVDSLFSSCAEAADRIQTFDEWTSNPLDPTTQSNSAGGLLDQLDTVERREIGQLIDFELMNHNNEGDPLHRHWT